MKCFIVSVFMSFMGVAVAAPVAAHAPTQIVVSKSEVSTCSAPVTLSWEVSANDDKKNDDDHTDDDDKNDSKPEVTLTVSSVDGSFSQVLVKDTTKSSFVWQSVNVAPGQYIVSAQTGHGVEFRPSDPFTVVPGPSLDCLPVQIQDATSTSISISDATSSSSSSATASSSVSAVAQAENIVPSASPTPSSISSSSTVSVPAVVGIVVGVTLLLGALALLYWRQMNRSHELKNVEYVYPPTPAHARTKHHEREHDARSSTDTVVEVRARAPTPIAVQSRKMTKQQMLASDLDLTETQKRLREL